MNKLGQIGNYIWIDENSDGYQDAGEPGIPNVIVVLYGVSGQELARTVTDTSGHYLFTGLPSGVYYVDVLDGTGGRAGRSVEADQPWATSRGWRAPSMATVRERGQFRLEGKEYRVQEGDVLHFRFNV